MKMIEKLLNRMISRFQRKVECIRDVTWRIWRPPSLKGAMSFFLAKGSNFLGYQRNLKMRRALDMVGMSLARRMVSSAYCCRLREVDLIFGQLWAAWMLRRMVSRDLPGVPHCCEEEMSSLRVGELGLEITIVENFLEQWREELLLFQLCR
ncbi:uncharacterized protein LOC143451581 isoform X3 [Clavelina lepadiformis]|uniref:uncharacterized protein LOC143451581 isoform X3 n=1 Tax=Clavelina lepadiformis TaxID=159417 RepID=UPI004043731F